MARGGKKPRRGGRKADARPMYPVRLLKEIGERLDLNDRKRKRPRKSAEEEPESVAKDVYEYEEGVPQEESGKNRRFDQVDNLEYELPDKFEDEEIDEDAASGDSEGMDRESDMDDEEVESMEEEGDAGSMEPFGEEEEEESDDDEQEEDIDEEAHDRMLEELTGKSRKRGRENDDEEGGYADAMSVQDLLAPVDKKSGVNALKKRVRVFQKNAAPASQPAPIALQDKLDRKAAYEKTTKEMTKWQPLVKRNREAPTLNFIKKANVSFQTTGEMTANFVPTTKLEKDVAAILKEYGADDPHKITAAEELELNKLTPEEAKKRRDKLAQMRSLLFRHEVKAKRLKKIKSKAFRRGERKAQQKSKPDMLIDDPELQKEAALKQETDRARERMTLKHKNTSKWAKRILQRGAQQLDEGTREALNEQLRKHALLTQKINATNAQSSSDDEESDLENETEPEGLVLEPKKQGGSAMAKAKLAMLKALEEGDNEVEMPKSGLFALPFMARAIERKRKEAENEAKALLEELEQADEDGNPGSKNVPIATGRRTFGGAQNQHVVKHDEEDEDAYERGSDSEMSEDERPQPSKPKVNVKPPRRVANEDTGAAEIQLDGLRMHVPEEDTVKLEGPISIRKTSGKRKKKNNKRKHAEAKSVIAANPTIFGTGMTINDVNAEPAANVDVTIAGQPNKRAKTEANVDEVEESDGAEEPEDEDNLLVPRTQEDLIREAFAGDDVEAEFEEMKRKAVDEECPKDKDEPVSLPGWGQWTDVQKKHGPPKWLIKQQEELKAKREAAKQRRQDAKLNCFIVSQKTDKKAAKYYASSVPFPFTSKEAYENSIRMPIGLEYNTYQSFREFTRPDVIKRTGLIIDPIEYEKPTSNDKKKKNNKAQRKSVPAKK